MLALLRRERQETATKACGPGFWKTVVGRPRSSRAPKNPNVILKAIDKIGADLVVMASLAPDTVREILVGSHADCVLCRTTCSILLVRG